MTRAITASARPSFILPRPGTYPANGFGLYDIYGNAFEWTRDWYHPKYYASAELTDPQGPKQGERKVLRGGWYGSTREGCNSVARVMAPPSAPGGGVRLVCEVDQRHHISAPATPAEAVSTATADIPHGFSHFTIQRRAGPL